MLKALIVAGLIALPAQAFAGGYGYHNGYYDEYYPQPYYGCGGCNGGYHGAYHHAGYPQQIQANPVAIAISNQQVAPRRRGCGGYGCGYGYPPPYYGGCR